jgi:hypothetical protein
MFENNGARSNGERAFSKYPPEARLSIYRPFAALTRDAEDAEVLSIVFLTERVENTMGYALGANIMGDILADIIYQNFPLRNSDKIDFSASSACRAVALAKEDVSAVKSFLTSMF